MTTQVTKHQAYVVIRARGVAVSNQSFYTVFVPSRLTVAKHNVYAAILPGKRLMVASHSAYAALFKLPTPPGARRIGMVISG